MSRVQYASAIGSLMYIIVYTMPGLAYAVSTVVSSYQIQNSNIEKQ